MESKKRGQLTLFMILGIILVIAIILVIVLRERLTIFLPERIVPTETSAIQRFIEGCAESVAQEGLAILGAQGGYIWLPPNINSNPLAFIDTGIKVPFWQYQTENRIPPHELMQAHLNRYVSENLRTCLADLEDFKKQYNIIEKGDITTETTITDQLVAFTITYPIDIVNKEGTKITEINQFRVESPIRLKHAYEVARSIMETEASEMRIEKIVVDLLALDPDIPLAGTELGCGRKIWLKSDVEQKIKTLVRTNIPSIRIASTNFVPVPDDQPYIQNHYVWRTTDIVYDDVRAALTFSENRPFQMAIRPSDGQVLKSSELRGQNLASFLCIQQWKFVYDLQFPVLVSVEDIQNNYNLNFGIQVQVRNNRGSREPLAQPTQFFEPIDASDESYCANRYGNYDMLINTFDNISDPKLGETHQPIDKVNVTFTCLKYTCEMGQSRYESGGAVARLHEIFPYCANGVLRANKPGYKTHEQFVTTTSGKEVSVYLTPVKTLTKYTVVKHLRLDSTTTAARPLDPDEKAFIALSYAPNKTVIHEAWGGYPAQSDVPQQSIELLAEADFPYKLEVFLTDENNGLLGGYSATWTPDWTELKDAREVEFHVVAKDVFANDAERLAFISSLQQFSAQIPEPVIR